MPKKKAVSKKKKARARSLAASRGWETRKKKARARSLAAKRGWETRERSRKRESKRRTPARKPRKKRRVLAGAPAVLPRPSRKKGKPSSRDVLKKRAAVRERPIREIAELPPAPEKVVHVFPGTTEERETAEKKARYREARSKKREAATLAREIEARRVLADLGITGAEADAQIARGKMEEADRDALLLRIAREAYERGTLDAEYLSIALEFGVSPHDVYSAAFGYLPMGGKAA